MTSSQYYTISNGNTALEASYIYLTPGDTTNIADAYSCGETLGTYSGQPNPVMNMTGNNNSWDGFTTNLTGHASANQLINSYDRTNLNNVTSYITNYSYTLVGQGRTSGETAVSGAGKLIPGHKVLYTIRESRDGHRLNHFYGNSRIDCIIRKTFRIFV